MMDWTHYRRIRWESGVTLIEMLVYIVILVMLVAVVVQVFLALQNSYRSLRSAQAIQSTAETALERMVRDIRDSESVDTALSTLGSSPGELMLLTTDDAGATTTIRFVLLDQVLRVEEAGLDRGPLSSATAHVVSLIFRHLTTAKSSAVKIEMTVESGEGGNLKSRSFYSTVVLRGSYPIQ